MTRLICVLLALLFSLSGPAMGANSDFDHSSLAAKTPLALPQFGTPTLDAVLASSRRAVGQTTEGARAIAKKLGHAQRGGYTSTFDGVIPTQSNADSIIESILSNPTRTFYGDKVIDVYDAVGRGGPRNFFSVKVFRMDLEADFKRLFGVVFWC